MRSLCRVPLTTVQLHNAKQQLIGQIAINNEVALNEMQAIGKSYMVYDHVDTLEEMSRDIESVTANEICEVANRYLNTPTISFLFYK